MRIVRYLSDPSDPSSVNWGCLIEEQVWQLAGDPLATPEPLQLVGSLASVRLISPCRPGKIVAMGINYPGATGSTESMTEPLVFLKAGTSASGPYDEIVNPFRDVQIWGECELAVVIGAKGKILGYTAANDVSAENLLDWDHHLARSKAADTFCPLGPWIDTEYSPNNRTIQGFQNGELIRQGNSDDRLWQDERAISWLSSWMTLEPWDVLLTGAPTRVVPRRFLQEGDEFVVKIDGLGVLKNRFRTK